MNFIHPEVLDQHHHLGARLGRLGLTGFSFKKFLQEEELLDKIGVYINFKLPDLQIKGLDADVPFGDRGVQLANKFEEGVLFPIPTLQDNFLFLPIIKIILNGNLLNKDSAN